MKHSDPRRAWYWPSDAPEPRAEVTDRPAESRLLGPDGKPLRKVERVPFGFQRPRKDQP